MQLHRPLNLRDVAAIEGDVAGLRDRVADVALERGRHQRIAAAPNEERRRLELVQPVPEALRLLQVDVARRRVEGGASPRRRVRAQELVDSGCRVARAAAW